MHALPTSRAHNIHSCLASQHIKHILHALTLGIVLCYFLTAVLKSIINLGRLNSFGLSDYLCDLDLFDLGHLTTLI